MCSAVISHLELFKLREEQGYWHTYARTSTTNAYEVLKRRGMQTVLGYTKLREIDPEAADVRLNSYKRHIERKFAREPYNLAPTINILVHEIDFVKTKEDNGELRWRFDAALQLMGLLSEALVTYMEATHRWADALAVVVDAADVQLRDIIREARLELGEDCDWYTIWELLCNEHSSTLDEDHNITTYYDKSIGDVQKILVARENAEKDS